MSAPIYSRSKDQMEAVEYLYFKKICFRFQWPMQILEWTISNSEPQLINFDKEMYYIHWQWKK